MLLQFEFEYIGGVNHKHNNQLFGVLINLWNRRHALSRTADATRYSWGSELIPLKSMSTLPDQSPLLS